MRVLTIALALVAAGTGSLASGSEPDGRQAAQAKRDQLHIAVQQICPVSGQKLGSMGPPIKVAVGEHKEVVFLCCKGCLKRQIDPQHWAAIHANFARAQGICPVMKHKLPANPKWTIVEGHIVYVCCPPCTKKIEADPGAFLRQLDELYSASLQTQTARR